ncbi:Ribosomal RNA processing protein 1, partial [Globisporangium splendens]
MENAASRFGQRLAHTEKKYRDQALKKLTVYLTKKADWTELEWDKLWKALFYCMWMSDKRPIQEELSTNLASLIHKIPTPENALGFVHSFFRTMHREWHGIDGLRLDKFYSLIRKFVHQSVLLLQSHDWDHDYVSTFVTIVSSEIISQLPNGLRMHLSDLYLVELYQAAGASVETDSFLLLLEPFFTLLSSEYDKTVFKRVRELVFLPMLSEYKFGPQPTKEAKEQSDESGETDGDDEDEVKVFEQVDLAHVQHRIFSIASADDTAERNRSGLYDLYSKFFAVTKIDSLKASQEAESVPKKSPKKSKKKDAKAEEAKTEEVATLEPTSEKKKKNKKRKKAADTTVEANVEATETAAVIKDEAVKSPQKKQKVATGDSEKITVKEEAKEPKAADSKKARKAKKVAEEAVPAKQEEKQDKKSAKEDKKAAKEDKKAAKEDEKKEMKEPELPKAKKEKKLKAEAVYTKPADEEKPKPAKKEVVVKSGMKFQRCISCNGFGKGFLPAAKDICAHCERSQKLQKKAAVGAAKKRKASELAASAAAAEAEAANAKKVTFGKNKALPHELSVKRLKASAKKDPVSKETTSSIKGVLKSTPPPAVIKKDSKVDKKKAGKGRTKAADFF